MFIAFRDLLKRLRHPITPRRRERRVRGTRFIPQLEQLENRVLLSGSWTPLTNNAPSYAGPMMLLSDGTVMAQQAGVTNNWYQLTPQGFSGSYTNGSWSSLQSMSTQREYYASNVLQSGKVFVVGGEFSSAGALTNSDEIYDPVANTWTNLPGVPTPLTKSAPTGSPAPPQPVSQFGDDPTEVLPNGKVLAGYIFGTQTYIFDPGTNQWTQGASKLHNDRSDEETWVKLSDGSILSYDVFASTASGTTSAQRYIPANTAASRALGVSDQWVDASNVDPNNRPGQLSDSSAELGPAFLLPDGRAFFLGNTGNTAFYTPSTNTWSAGPQIPGGLPAGDQPGAMLPNGDVLFAAKCYNGSNSPHIYEFNPNNWQSSPNHGYTDVTPSNYNLAVNYPFMLVLPSGQVLLSNTSNQLEVYTPEGAPNNAWLPTISSISRSGSTVTLTGTQINGISEGASYGDDAEMSSNYPLVELLGAPFIGNAYLRTSNWSSTGVAEGNTPESVQFQLGTGTDLLLHVVANGIASPTALAIEMSASSISSILLRVDPSNPANLQILSNGSFLDSVPFSSFSSIMVTGDPTLDNLLTVDYSNGNPIPGGGLNYQGGSSLIVNDSADAATHTITMADNGGPAFGQITGLGTISYSNSPLGVTIETGTGTNTVNVYSTPLPGKGPVDLEGHSANTTVNVGNGTTQNIRNGVTITNPPSVTTLNVDDSQDSGTRTTSINTWSFDSTYGQINGLSANNGSIFYHYADTRSVTVKTGTGTNTVNVQDVVKPLTLVGNSSSTAVNVGKSGSLASIQGALTVHNPSSYTDLTLDDSADTFNRTVTVTSTGVSGFPTGTISYFFNDLKSLTVLGGSGNNTYTVSSTPGNSAYTGTTLNTGGGNNEKQVYVQGTTTPLTVNMQGTFEDSVIVGSANNALDTIQGAVGVNFSAGIGQSVVINDQGASTVPRTYTITSTTLDRTGAARISFSGGNTTTNLNAAGGGNVINVQGNPGGLTVNAGAGNDTINVGSATNSLDGLGNVSIDGQGGSNTLYVNDQGTSTSQNYSVVTSIPSVGRSGVFIRYSNIASLVLNGGGGGNTFAVQGTLAGTAVTVNPGGGTNTVNVGTSLTPSSTLDLIQSVVTVNGQGSTAVILNDQGKTTAQGYVFLDAGSNAGTFFRNFSPGAVNYNRVASVTLNGGSGGNTFNVTSTSTVPALTLNGGSGTNTLVGPNVATTWEITGSNAGFLLGTFGRVNFSAVQNLTGGSGNDDFFFANGAGVSGNINGGGGINMLDYLNYTTAVAVDLTVPVATGVGGSVANIQTLQGGQSDDTLTGNAAGTTTFLASPGNDTVTGLGSGNTLIGTSAVGTWNVTAQNAGTLTFGASTTTFSGVQNLTGGGGADNFVLADGTGVDGSINGSGGGTLDESAYSTPVTVDLSANTATGVGGNAFNLRNFIGSAAGGNSLNGPNAATTWYVYAQNSILIDGVISFSGFQNLTGGTAADTFFLTNGAGVDGNIDGGGGSNILDYGEDGAAATVTVDLSANTATGVGGSIANLQRFVGDNAISDSLNGPDANTTWNLSGSNAGTLTGGFNFTAFQNLTGGAGDNTFVLAAGAVMDGGITGGGGNNTLAGPNTATTWSVAAQNSGTLSGGARATFSGMQNLTGGLGVDAFLFANGVGIDGNLDGGGGSNTLNESAYTTPVTVDLTANTATGVGGTIANLQNFVGSAGGGNNLNGPAANTIWNLSGSNAGTLTGGFGFTAFQNLTGGGGDNTFDFANGTSAAGIITGGGGTNTLDYSAYTSDVLVDLQTGQATAVAGGVANIVNVHGANSSGAGLYNLLIGAGGDVLTGGSGRRNILVAGASASTLIGGNGDDLLIGGSTSYDTEAGLTTWQQIAAYWAGSDSYSTRVSNLENGNGVPLLDATIVSGNGGGNTLTGLGELALIYSDGSDTISGFNAGSQTVTISP